MFVAMAMVASYEDVRKQRMEENNRKMEALGLLGLAQSLKPEKKNGPVKRPANTRRVAVEGEFAMEARRSSRLGGKPAVSYSDQMEWMPGMRMRVGGRERQPLARRYLSDAARMAAIDAAEEVYKGLVKPAFVKPMLHSHTASGFWLGLPANFCKEFLPHRDDRVTLEDEKSLEWECVYLANKVGLSGGWRGFSLDHELVDGDCLIFELTEPRRFKVHVFRCEEEYEGVEEAGENEGGVDGLEKEVATEKKVKPMKYHKKAPASAPPDLAKGRKLSAFTRRLDLEDGEGGTKEGNDGSLEASKNVKEEVEKDVAGPPRSSKRRRVNEEEDSEGGVDPQSVKKEAKSKKQKQKDSEGEVVELDSDDEVDEDAKKPSPQSKDTQTGIRAFGRITRNSLAKALPKKGE